MLPTIIRASDVGWSHAVNTATRSRKKNPIATRMTTLMMRRLRPRRRSPAMSWPTPGTIADAKAASHGLDAEGGVPGADIDEMVSPRPQ